MLCLLYFGLRWIRSLLSIPKTHLLSLVYWLMVSFGAFAVKQPYIRRIHAHRLCVVPRLWDVKVPLSVSRRSYSGSFWGPMFGAEPAQRINVDEAASFPSSNDRITAFSLGPLQCFTSLLLLAGSLKGLETKT